MVPKLQETGQKWFNSPVFQFEGSIEETATLLPRFERRKFALAPEKGNVMLSNVRLEMIVRMAGMHGMDAVPVGIASKDYALIQHTDVLAAARASLENAGIDLADVTCHLQLTEYGERMALGIILPESYAFAASDGYPLSLRLECINSVEGSTRFRAMMGWYRFVCSNGLVIGSTRSELHRRHSGGSHVHEMQQILISGIKEAMREKALFSIWQSKTVTMEMMTPWLTDVVRKTWGLKAAARVYHIAISGHDAVIQGPYKGKTPLTLLVRPGAVVPGSVQLCRTLYDLAQILAWLAKDRKDVQEQLEWRGLIPGMIAKLERNRIA